MLTLDELYKAIENRFPFFSTYKPYRVRLSGGSTDSTFTDPYVQNSIRHNLSLNSMFIKIPRPITAPGKGCRECIAALGLIFLTPRHRLGHQAWCRDWGARRHEKTAKAQQEATKECCATVPDAVAAAAAAARGRPIPLRSPSTTTPATCIRFRGLGS